MGTKINLKEELRPYANLAEDEISKYTNRKPEELYAPLRDLFSRGGKRLRPALVMLSCEACGGKKEDAITIAASIEMTHNFTLIHDDIADKSELRRGKPCLHHIYGLGTAINCGDGLFCIANEALADAASKVPKDKADLLTKKTVYGVTQVAEGQSLDIGWAEHKVWDITEEDYFTMIKGKTGALMATSCVVGGIIAGASEDELEALEKFGMGIGIGFQIWDDVLNVSADLEKYGKEIGGDINEGKRTLMVIDTLSKCTAEEKTWLIEVLDKVKNTQEEIRDAISLLNKYDSIEMARKRAISEMEKGKHAIDNISLDSKAKDILLEAADYMVRRDL